MPLFQIGNHAYAVLLVPILLGLKFSVRHSVPRELFLKMSKSMYLLVGVGVVLAVVSYFVPTAVLPSIIVLWLGYYLTLMLAKRRDHQQSFEYSEVMNGIRVIGIQPETPQQKWISRLAMSFWKSTGLKLQMMMNFTVP